MDSMTP
jgi:hypothetical protein